MRVFLGSAFVRRQIITQPLNSVGLGLDQADARCHPDTSSAAAAGGRRPRRKVNRHGSGTGFVFRPAAVDVVSLVED